MASPSSFPNFSSRRRFVRHSLAGLLAGALGSKVVFARNLPSWLPPVAMIDPQAFESLLGKHSGLTLLNDRPWNIETPAHLLDDTVTPANRLFVRNNGLMPADPDPDSWTLTVEGESAINPVTFSLDELKNQFTHFTYQLTLECGGNGRSEFNPPASGNQWTTGAVGCPEWTGVRLRDVLEAVGIRDDAVYVAYYGKDRHLSGDPKKVPISRGVPLAKALEPEGLIAWAMNGKPLPLAHGFPLRLIFGGWPGSTSGKWLHRLLVRNQVHDGPKMTGYSYRVPKYSVPPGAEVPETDMEIIQSMPVKSLVTRPKTGAVIELGQELFLRGHAWAGDLEVHSMDISIDFGATWLSCALDPPRNRHAWQHWNTSVRFPQKGYYEVWARATDSNGVMQPMVVPGWNPKGYLNNAAHRIAIKVV